MNDRLTQNYKLKTDDALSDILLITSIFEGHPLPTSRLKIEQARISIQNTLKDTILFYYNTE